MRMWNERENRLFSFIQHFLRLPSNGRKKMMALRRQKIDEERERERRRSKRCRNDDDEKARGDAILSSLLFPLSSSFDSSVILECSFFTVFCLLRLKSPSSDRRKRLTMKEKEELTGRDVDRFSDSFSRKRVSSHFREMCSLMIAFPGDGVDDHHHHNIFPFVFCTLFA